MKTINSDIAYDFIRKRILNKVYAPGEALMTDLIAKEIGISRTPVRDALRQLEADGLVLIRAHRGASVKAWDIKEFREACALRLALESYTAGLAAKTRTESDLQEMEMALEEMRRLTQRYMESPSEELMKDLGREDVRFHIALITATKNDMLKKEILRLHLINRVISGAMPVEAVRNATNADRFEVTQDALRDHEKIYDAVHRGDEAAAKAAMEAHIQYIIDTSLKKMALARTRLPRELTDEELTYTS